MGRFTKRVIGGLTAALMLLAGGATAQDSWLDRFESASNMNEFGDYWYFFDDNLEKSGFTDLAGTAGGKGSSVVSSAEVKGSGTSRELLFTEEKSITATGGRGGTKGAKFAFTWGNTFQTPYDNRTTDQARDPSFASVSEVKGMQGTGKACPDYECGPYDFAQFVGIGTNLVPDGERNAPKGFEDAKELKFWARADDEVSVWVFFEQSNMGWYGKEYDSKRKEGIYYGQWVTITESWAEYTVPLEEAACSKKNKTDETCPEATKGLRQPDFVADQGLSDKRFDLTKVVKVAWQAQAADAAATVMGNKNLPVGEGTKDWGTTIYLDDIRFTGFKFVAPDLCESCIGVTRPSDASQLDDFANSTAQNTLGYYWYFYDDTKAETTGDKGNSTIGNEDEKDCESEYVDTEKGECEALIQGSGSNKFLSGEYLLGRKMKIDGEDVNPFVGIGTSLFDEKASSPTYFKAGSDVNGVYFEYNTGSGANKVTFEVQDKYDAEGKRPAAAVFYVDLPATDGDWLKAAIPFDRLVQHAGWESVKAYNDTAKAGKTLDRDNLAKLQFKVQGASGDYGELQIRSVWLLGDVSSKIKLVSNKAKTIGLRATYNRGVVGVNWNAAQNIASGRVSLVNVKGRTVATAPLVKAGGKVTANLGKGTIPTGMYFVRINAKDVQGKKVVRQVPLSVIK